MTKSRARGASDDAPPMSAADALHRLDVMIACMDMWEGKRGQMADLMRGWARWLRHVRPHVEAAASVSNAPAPAGWQDGSNVR